MAHFFIYVFQHLNGEIRSYICDISPLVILRQGEDKELKSSKER